MDPETQRTLDRQSGAMTKTAKKKTKAKKPAKKTKKAAKRKASKPAKGKAPKSAGTDRSERLDMRLTKSEKVKLLAKAKKLRRTITSIVIEAIEKLR